jgi:tetratricopeptide (TPR) repeat protein
MASSKGSAVGVLVLGAAVTLAAAIVGARLTNFSPREMPAPEGWAALARQEPSRAADIFAAALEQQPRNPLLHFGAGASAYALGRKQSAMRSLRTAVEIDPNLDDAQELLGHVAYELGETSLAITSMERAAARRPRDRERGELLDRWRRESKAHASYDEKPAEHFRILYEGGTQQAIGSRVASVLESEHARLATIFDKTPPAPVTVVLYTNQTFHDLTRSPAWAAGHYDGRIRVAVGGEFSSSDLDRLLAHELVHAFVAASASRRVPAWLDEGLATYLQSTDRNWIPAVLHGAEALPFEALTRGFSGLDERAALVAYAESATAVEILHARLGSKIGRFASLIGDGTPLDRALLEFQLQPDAFHAEWRRRVGLR